MTVSTRHIFGFAVLALVAMGLSAEGWATADDVNTTSHVVAATIFPDRALVTREAKVHVSAGPHTVVIADVPAGLDESSLRVQGSATAAVKIGTVELKRVFLTEAANAAQRDKTAAIEAKQNDKALLEAEIKALQTRANFIDTIVAAGATKTDASGTTKLDFSPDKWAQAWGLIQTGMAETEKNLATENIALGKVNDEIAKLQQELNQVQTLQNKERRDVHVQIEAAQDTDLQVSLTYQTRGARWTPVYDARLETATGALALEQYGQALQQTGEDWSGVALTLSTAQPSFGSEMPQLSDWFVRLFHQVVALAQSRAKDASMSTFAVAASGGVDLGAAEAQKAAAPLPLMQQQAIVQSSEYAAEFRVPGQIDLKSAAEPTKMFIGSAHMTAKLSARVTPRLAQMAYLFAKAKNDEKYPLIPGTVAKYRDGAFIGNADLAMLRSGETADLSFGVDDRIKVTYKRTREEQANPTLVVVGDMKIEREYEAKVQNLHKDPIDVTVYEQYPSSADPDVKTELIDEVTTPDYVKDPENRQGVIAWTATLKPQEEKTYTLGFRVRYPKDQRLMGL